MGYHLNPSDIIAMPLAPLARYVLLVMNDYGWPCWPSQEVLAKKTGLGLRTIQNVLHQLRQGGVLNSSGTGKALTYELLQVPAEVRTSCVPKVRRRCATSRTTCVAPAQQMRTRYARGAQGSEPLNEPLNEPPARRQQLDELPPSPAAEKPLGFAEAMRVLPALAKYARNPADAPPAGVGVPDASTDPRALAVAQERLEALRAGRLYA